LELESNLDVVHITRKNLESAMSQSDREAMILTALIRTRNSLAFAVSMLQDANLDDQAEKLEKYIDEADRVLDDAGCRLSRS
jgi:hypothetical protein